MLRRLLSAQVVGLLYRYKGEHLAREQLGSGTKVVVVPEVQ